MLIYLEVEKIPNVTEFKLLLLQLQKLRPREALEVARYCMGIK